MRSLQRTTGPAPKQPEIPGINGLRLDLKEIPRGRMPRLVRPMLATPVNEPFDKPGWLYEVKWDGYRAIAEIDRRGVSFYSRNFLSFVQRFAPIVRSFRRCDALERRWTDWLSGRAPRESDEVKPRFGTFGEVS